MASKIEAKSSQAWSQSMLEIDRVLHHFAVVATEVAHGSDCHMHCRNTPVNDKGVNNLEATRKFFMAYLPSALYSISVQTRNPDRFPTVSVKGFAWFWIRR